MVDARALWTGAGEATDRSYSEGGEPRIDFGRPKVVRPNEEIFSDWYREAAQAKRIAEAAARNSSYKMDYDAVNKELKRVHNGAGSQQPGIF